MGFLSLNWKKLEIRVEDLKVTLILQKGRFSLILFFKCVLSPIQEGPFRGCSRMKGVKKVPPL